MPSNYQLTNKNVINASGILVAVRTEQTLITESPLIINKHEERTRLEKQITSLQDLYSLTGTEAYFGHLDQINNSINYFNQL